MLKNRWFSAVCLLLICALCFIIFTAPPAISVFSSDHSSHSALILDAGHGGIDGGAVSADGTVESQLNLQITRRLFSLFLFLGHETVLTRTGEGDLSSPDAESIKEQKVSDLHARVKLINGYENAVVISIHQNMLPGHPTVRGAQVFYNRITPAEELAATMQQSLNRTVNSKDRVYKAIDPGVFLMKEVRHPAVLVECGFLSSPSEAALLSDPSYQKQLAAAIAAGFLQFHTKEGAI